MRGDEASQECDLFAADPLPAVTPLDGHGSSVSEMSPERKPLAAVFSNCFS
jgi:hypothetical protein